MLQPETSNPNKPVKKNLIDISIEDFVIKTKLSSSIQTRAMAILMFIIESQLRGLGAMRLKDIHAALGQLGETINDPGTLKSRDSSPISILINNKALMYDRDAMMYFLPEAFESKMGEINVIEKIHSKLNTNFKAKSSEVRWNVGNIYENVKFYHDMKMTNKNSNSTTFFHGHMPYSEKTLEARTTTAVDKIVTNVNEMTKEVYKIYGNTSQDIDVTLSEFESDMAQVLYSFKNN